jgi:hypothetical protein
MHRNKCLLMASRIAILALLCDGVPQAPPPACVALIACSVDSYDGDNEADGEASVPEANMNYFTSPEDSGCG